MFPHGLMFHHFHNSTHPEVQGSISVDDFSRIIDHYGRDRILSADEWLARLQRQDLRETHVCITFDDCLKCQFDVAYPLLEQSGIKAFWFCYSSPLIGELNRLEIYRTYRTQHFGTIEEFYRAFSSHVAGTSQGERVARSLQDFSPAAYLPEAPFYSDEDRVFRFVRDDVLGPEAYEDVMDSMIAAAGIDLSALARDIWMSPRDLRELRTRGHIIGLHSHTHPTKIERLDYAAQYEEYRTNSLCLETICGEKPTTMSHPSDSYNRDTLEVLRSLGVILGFRANMTEPALSDLEFPRQDHANIMSEMGR